MGESKKISAWGFREVIVLFAVIGFFLWVSANMPGFLKEPVTSPANACINNMLQIDGAINEWALDKGKTNGTFVTERDIANYIKLDWHGKILPCPSGGKYTYGKVGDTPQISCSLSTANPPHKLP